MFKLIVSDIDGTLVPTGGRLPSPMLVETLTHCLDLDSVYTSLANKEYMWYVDANGMPVRILITEGTRADCKEAVHLIEGISARAWFV